MIFTPFTSPEAAFEACEAAGLEPLRGSDHQFGTKYGVFLPGAERYINIYTNEGFLGWCNSYFRMLAYRKAAGWEQIGALGWVSPDNTGEADWADEGWPFPEDEGFADWFTAFFHYDALDAGVEPNPYPNQI